MTFDPSIYDIPTKEVDATIPDDQWVERFVARIKEVAETLCGPDDDGKMDKYARSVVVSAYLPDRRIYTDPEDAADTDISQWEPEE